MEQLQQLEKEFNSLSNKIKEVDDNIKTMLGLQKTSEDIIKKTTTLKEKLQSQSQQFTESINTHQQKIERQISELRSALGNGKAGERVSILNEEDMSQLEILIGKVSGDIIYQASVDGFNNESFNKNVGGKQSVAIIVFDSEGNIFGSYNGKAIPLIEPNEDDELPPAKGLYSDNEHILFVLRKKGVSDVKKFGRVCEGYSLWTFGQINKLFSVNGAFVLVNECNRTFESSISGNFRREYGEDVFIDKKKFMVRDILAITFN